MTYSHLFSSTYSLSHFSTTLLQRCKKKKNVKTLKSDYNTTMCRVGNSIASADLTAATSVISSESLQQYFACRTNRDLYELISDYSSVECNRLVDVLGLSKFEIFDILLHSDRVINQDLTARLHNDVQEGNLTILSIRQQGPSTSFTLGEEEIFRDTEGKYMTDQAHLQEALQTEYGVDLFTLISKLITGEIRPAGMNNKLLDILDPNQVNMSFLSRDHTPTDLGPIDIRHERNIIFNSYLHGPDSVIDVVYEASVRLEEEGLSDPERARLERLKRKQEQAISEETTEENETPNDSGNSTPVERESSATVESSPMVENDTTVVKDTALARDTTVAGQDRLTGETVPESATTLAVSSRSASQVGVYRLESPTRSTEARARANSLSVGSPTSPRLLGNNSLFKTGVGSQERAQPQPIVAQPLRLVASVPQKTITYPHVASMSLSHGLFFDYGKKESIAREHCASETSTSSQPVYLIAVPTSLYQQDSDTTGNQSKHINPFTACVVSLVLGGLAIWQIYQLYQRKNK